MKYLKMLELLASAVLVAFAGTASASTLTGPTSGATMKVGETIQLTSTNIEMHGPYTTSGCGHSIIKGEVTQNGTVGSTTNAGVKVTTLHFSNCNYNVTEAKKLGTLEFNKLGEGFWSGMEIAIHTSVGECVFTTNNTKIGLLTGDLRAVLDIGSASIPRTGGSIFCGSSSTWTASYAVTSPAYLAVH